MRLNFRKAKMSPDLNQEKQSRVNFLTDVAQKTIDYVANLVQKEYGDEEAGIARSVARVNSNTINHVVEYYYDLLLHEYKKKNGYYDDERLSGRDKLAALTTIAIVTFRPIDIAPYHGPSIAIAQLNELFALFFASIVLHVEFGAGNNAKAGAEIVIRNLLLNIRDLGLTSRQRARSNSPLRSTESLADWVIQSMQLYGVAYGKIDLRL